MILRRIASAFRQQDWFTVAVEVMIVVLGVFIGLQVNNWNGQRGDRAAYDAALERLSDEIDTNLATFDVIDAEFEPTLTAVQDMAAALETCSDAPEIRDRINASIFQIAGTTGFLIRRSALTELTSDPRLLAQQSGEMRARLSELLFYTDLSLREGRFYEDFPLERNPVDNPALKIGGRRDLQVSYFGIDYKKSYRTVELAVPVSVACSDNALIKDIWTWERYQANLPVLVRHMRKEYAATRVLIESEAS